MTLFYVGSLVFFLVLMVLGYWWVEETGILGNQPSYKKQKGPIAWTYIEIPRVTVSLGQGTFMQIQLDLALEVEPKNAAVIEGYIPKIADRLNGFFPRVDLDDIQESRSMFLLRKNMLWQINQVGAPVPIHDVIIQKMVIM